MTTISVASSAVAWWPTHEFISAVVAQANYGPLPVAGTPTWCDLCDGDPRKLLALAVFGEHHALRVETAHAKRCQVGRDVSQAADWSAIGRERLQINSFYKQRPWLQRVGGHHV